MKKLLAILLLTALPLQAQAQGGLGVKFPGPGHSAYSGGASYSGPGDVIAAQGYWSAGWAYSAATRGNNAIQACAAGDAGGCQNIPTDATTGLLSVSTVNVNGSPCNDTTNVCTIKIFYDQTGNGHTMTQNTEANRATLLVACTGLGTGVACGTANAGVTYSDAGSTTQAQPFTSLWVANRNTSTGTDDMVMGANDFSFKVGYGFFSVANRVNCNAGSDQQVSSVNDGTWNQVACVMNGASGNIQINSTSNTKNMGTTGVSSGTLRIFTDGGGTSFHGKIAMVGWYTSGLSSGDITSISSAQHTIGGF